MISLHAKKNGFTIVELLIVIVVVVILSAVVINTHSSIEIKQRNNTRVDRINSLQVQLESFYSQNGYYPSNSDMNSSSWIAKNMKSLNTSDMIDPSSPKGTKPALAKSPTAKVFSYGPSANGLSCEHTDTTCNEYTLTATFEGSFNGEKTYTKLNLGQS
jgi:prepilin-type N-terminal cleavage/methylation domain-containing protein